MSLTQTAIRRPVFVIMFVLALVILGYLSSSKMPQENLPDVELPMVTVSTAYPGAGPSEIESLVSEPIEKSLSSLGRLKYVTSMSQDNVSNVMLEFEMGTDLDAAAADIRDKISAIQSQLPKEADKSMILKLNTSSAPVVTIGLTGTLPAREMRALADDTVSERLAKVGGVGSVNVFGGLERELSVAVDKERLDAYGLGIGNVIGALSSSNLNVPAGAIQEDARNYSVRTVGSYTSLQDIKNAKILLPQGGTIRVGEVAEVTDTVAEPDVLVRLNGQSSVILSVQKQSGANTVRVADGVKKELAAISQELPTGVDYVVASDQSTSVKDSIRDVNKSLLEGILLVILIVFLFLHSARATFIVALAIPTSMMATYLPTSLLGFTQNTMVLLGLSLSVGILVDDSIVVLENIERHLRLREKREEAAVNGRGEIGLAAIAITLVDVAVFVPMSFMGGITGQFFRQFGLTVASATAFSLLMSFILTPMLASKMMESEEEKERKKEALERRRSSGRLNLSDRLSLFTQGVFQGLERAIRALDRKYRSLLEWALHNRFLTLVIGNISLLAVVALMMPPLTVGAKGAAVGPRVIIALIALGTAALAMFINRKSKGVALGFGVAVAIIALTIHFPFGFGFFPDSDEGNFTVAIRTAPGTSLAATDKVVRQVEEVVSRLPELKTVNYRVSDSVWYNPSTWTKHHTESQTGYSTALVGSGSTSLFSSNSGPQYGTVSVKVVGKKYRKRSINEIVDWVAGQTAHIPGADLITVSASQSLSAGNGISREIQGRDMDAILAEARVVADVMRKTPGAVDVDISYKPTAPGRRIVVDRDKVAELGLSVAQVGSAARTALSGDDSVKFRENGTEYPIRVRYALPQRDKVTDLDNVIVATKDGAPVYLSDVAKIVYEQAPARIDRKDRQRVVTVTANIANGYQLGNVNQALERSLSKVPVVPGTTIRTGGSTQMMTETIGNMAVAFGLSILLVYMVMSALFESMLTPLVIMFCLPQALIGALLALLLTGTPMLATAMIGMIMLVGLVMKNAILLIDYTNTLMQRGKSRYEALLEAGETRLRPILMTTLAMVGGMLPTALALSEGSEMRAPMSITVIGGLVVSTLLTLVVIPVVFSLVDDVWKALARRSFTRRAVDREATALSE